MYDAVKAVVVMSYRGCHVLYNGCDIVKTIADVISELHLL